MTSSSPSSSSSCPVPHRHVAAGVLWCDDKILVTQRPKDKHMAGLWEFPGGKTEAQDASLEHALARELQEELAITALPQDMALIMTLEVLTPHPLTLHFFSLSVWQGDICPQEGQAAVWADTETFNTLPLLSSNAPLLPWLRRQLAQRLKVRVYLEDTDAGGIVYHATYLAYAERGRTEFLRKIGIDHGAMVHKERVCFVVRHCAITYHHPARLDDQLLVQTQMAPMDQPLHGARVYLQQHIRRGQDLLTTLDLELALMDMTTGKPRRIPKNLVYLLQG